MHTVLHSQMMFWSCCKLFMVCTEQSQVTHWQNQNNVEHVMHMPTLCYPCAGPMAAPQSRERCWGQARAKHGNCQQGSMLQAIASKFFWRDCSLGHHGSYNPNSKIQTGKTRVLCYSQCLLMSLHAGKLPPCWWTFHFRLTSVESQPGLTILCRKCVNSGTDLPN